LIFLAISLLRLLRQSGRELETVPCHPTGAAHFVDFGPDIGGNIVHCSSFTSAEAYKAFAM
jgi:hypothetical protein